MPTPRDAVTGLPRCAVGFHCPYFNASDPATYPRFCAPSPACAARRLFGFLCSSPQGGLEPFLCPAGHYCPSHMPSSSADSNSSTIEMCPPQHYCPGAVAAPLPCPRLSLCPAGTAKPRFVGGLLAALLALAAVAVAVVVYRRWAVVSRPPLDFADTAAALVTAAAAVAAFEASFAAPSAAVDHQAVAATPAEGTAPQPATDGDNADNTSDSAAATSSHPQPQPRRRRTVQVLCEEDISPALPPHDAPRRHHRRVTIPAAQISPPPTGASSPTFVLLGSNGSFSFGIDSPGDEEEEGKEEGIACSNPSNNERNGDNQQYIGATTTPSGTMASSPRHKFLGALDQQQLLRRVSSSGSFAAFKGFTGNNNNSSRTHFGGNSGSFTQNNSSPFFGSHSASDYDLSPSPTFAADAPDTVAANATDDRGDSTTAGAASTVAASAASPIFTPAAAAVLVLAGGFRLARGGPDTPPLHINLRRVRCLPPPTATRSKRDTRSDGSGHYSGGGGLSMALLPTKVTAIIGPSGCGKSTLLRAIAGRLPAGWATTGSIGTATAKEGEMEIEDYDAASDDRNAMTAKEGALPSGCGTSPSAPATTPRRHSQHYTLPRHRIGFVPQGDLLHRELTVFQNLYFSAQLRLPLQWPPEDKAYFLSAVLEALHLHGPRDLVIGDEEARGVSGGQRRRTSIGMELVAAPSALLLDEPTSGLDSTTALEVCACLQAIAVEAGLTVAMTISQPRVEIWNALDEIVVLSRGGRCAFQGPQHDAKPYFEHIAKVFGARSTETGASLSLPPNFLVFSPQSNPADVILDAVAVQGDLLADLWAQKQNRHDQHDQSVSRGACDPHNQKQISAGTPPSSAHDNAPFGADPNEEERRATLLKSQRDAHAVHKANQPHDAPLVVSFWRQTLCVFQRAVSVQLADIRPLAVEVIANVLVAGAIGQSLSNFEVRWPFREYKLVSVTPPDHIPRVCLFIQLAVGIASSPAGVGVFANDLHCAYSRECRVGLSPLAYYLGTAAAAVPRILLCSLCFATLFHFLPSLYIDFSSLYLLVGLSMGCAYAISAVVAMICTARDAPLVAAAAAIVLACFSGFIAFPLPLKVISHGFWASAALVNLFYEPFAHVYTSNDSAEFGWPDGEGVRAKAVAILIAIGSFYHCVAYGLLRWYVPRRADMAV